MKYLALIAVILIGILSACSNPSDPNYDNDYNNIKNLGIKEAVALANDWKFSKKEIISFITPKELTITFPDGRKVVTALPDDEMYVAVAPWINYTHSCSVHYLSSCQGELENKIFEISVKEKSDNLIFEGPVTSMKNGFFELWLPRDLELVVDISYDGKTAGIVLLTDNSCNTCFTEARLK